MYKAISIDNKVVYGDVFTDNINNKQFIREYDDGQGYPCFIAPNFIDTEIKKGSTRMFTGYYAFSEPIFFGDKLSNNLGTNKEIIREVVEFEGCKMLKIIKGKSRMPEYISLHDHHACNYRVIN